jgi:hypothetical protein
MANLFNSFKRITLVTILLATAFSQTGCEYFDIRDYLVNTPTDVSVTLGGIEYNARMILTTKKTQSKITGRDIYSAQMIYEIPELNMRVTIDDNFPADGGHDSFEIDYIGIPNNEAPPLTLSSAEAIDIYQSGLNILDRN